MGAVYEAKELATGRAVAVKRVHAIHDERRKDIERLRMEARAVKLVEHPNVVEFYDYGEDDDGRPFIVMELLKGRSLAQEIKKDGALPMPIERAAWIVLQAARGVAAAHAQGLVHRDIKPGNIYLLGVGGGGKRERVKVLDFGLVAGPTRLSDRLTLTGVVLGTPHYIPPEMIDHPPRVSPGADVYALGVLLYQLAVGHRPFDGDSFFAVIDAHLTQPIPKPRHTDSGQLIPRALRKVWTQALDKDPDARFLDARVFAEALDDAVFGVREGVATAPQSPLQHVGRQRKLITVLTVRLAAGARAAKALAAAARRIQAQGGLAVKDEGSVAVRAIFGLPTAATDDALRALRAALSLREMLGEESGHRAEIGLHTRFSVVAPRAGAKHAWPVDRPWQAAELVGREGLAHGAIALSGTTYRTLRRHLLEPLPVVANVATEAVYAVPKVGPVLRAAGAGQAPERTQPLVGRDRELGRLMTGVDQALRSRTARFGLICGAAGMGKSRMLTEVATAAAARHPGLQVLEASPQAHRKAPFNVFRALLTDAVGNTGARGDKVVQWVTEAISVLGQDKAREDAWAILQLVGLRELPQEDAAAPRVARQKAFAAFGHLLRAVAAQGGVLLLVDDAHDADSGSLDLLDYLARELHDFPVAILMAGRADEQLVERYTPVFTLDPLSPASARALALSLLAPKRVGERLLHRLLDRAEGVPLFLEELIRVVQEGPRERLERLPDSIRAVVGARIDGLSLEARRVLQAAAVVGRDFWSGAIGAQPQLGAPHQGALPDTLSTLTRRGFVVAAPASRFDGEAEWRFANESTYHVAYELNTQRALREGHFAVAHWLAARTAGTGPVPHALIALHLERAGDMDRAARAWRAAGDQARDRFANREAAADYQRALRLEVGWSGAETSATQLELGIVLHLSGHREPAEKALRAVADNAAASPEQRSRALRHLARGAAWIGQVERQMQLLDLAVRAAGEGADLPERLLVASDLAYALVRAGQTQRAEGMLEGAIQTAYQADQLGPVLLPLGQLHQTQSILHRNQGRLADAESEARAAVDLFDQLGYSAGVATTLTSLSVCLRDLGRFEEAARAAARSAELFREWGYGLHELTARINLAWTHLERGAPEPARLLLRRLRAEFAGAISQTEAVLIDAGAALAAQALGFAGEAETFARSCLKAGSGAELGEVRGWALYAAGRVLRETGMLEDSAACWRMLDRPAWLARTLEALVTLESPPMSEVHADEARTIRERLGTIRTASPGAPPRQ